MTLQMNDPDRLAEFQRRLAAAGLTSPTAPAPETRAEESGRRELRPTEAGLWFLDRMHPGSPDYIVAVAVAVSGRLDTERLAAAFASVVAAHPQLRTRFGEVDGKAYAETVPVPPPRLAVETVADLDAWLRRTAVEPFDLAAGELVRLRLAAAGDQQVVLLTAHHIVVDGTALDLLGTELFTRYAGREPATAPIAAPAPAPAADSSLDWWRARLAGATLPEPASAGPRRGRRIGADLDSTVRERVDAVARAYDVTRPAVFAAAFRIVTRALFAHDDLLIGTPVNLRTEQQAAALGNFANLVCLRNPLRPAMRLADLLRAEQQMLIEAIAHRDTPFDQVAKLLRDEAPVQVVFTHHRTRTRHEVLIGDLALRRLDVDLGTTKFDLTLQVEEGDERTRIWLEHDRSRYPADVAQSVLDSCLLALAAIADRPDTTLGEVSLGAAAPIAPTWTPVGTRGVVGWFEDRAANTPDRVAVDGDEPVSYAQLDAWADRVAYEIDRSATTSPVAVLTGRTAAMVAAILGVAKAGRTYLPIDPEHPPQRIRRVLGASGAEIIVTAGEVEPPPGLRVVDADACRAADLPGDRSRPAIPWTAPLYRIYTSGSTGEPKGVEVTHENLGSLIDGARELLALTENDRWSLFHSIAFDFSVWELWGPLVTGATVVPVDRTVARAPERFSALLRDRRITVLNQTPTAFGAISALASPTDLPDLRLVVFGGEALRPSTLTGWFDGPRLVNMYGITETTVHVTWRDITRADVDGGTSPIGGPLPTLSAVVADADLRPQPLGFPGELLVGGVGVSLGYRGSPSLTALRFIPDLAGGGGRMYRTGDRVRARAGGDLDYLGRLDGQLKVRGFRVEPAEIEHVLLEHPAVSAAGVVAGTSGPALVGFVQADAGVDLDAIHDFASARLPAHMVPRLHRVDLLPRTVNGKLDRGVLRDLASVSSVDEQAGHVPPAGERERAVAAVWQELLGTARVGVTDNFFRLGGDSILAVRVAAAMTAQGIPVTVADIFDRQTIRALIAASGGTGPESRPTATADHRPMLAPADRESLPAGVEDAYPLTLLQQGMLFHQFEQNSYLNVTTTRVSCQVFDAELLRQAYDRVVQRHPVLRSGFDLAGFSEPLQLVWRHVAVDFPVLDWRGRPADEVRRDLKEWMGAQRREPLDLSRPPLLRFTAHRTGDTEFWLSAVECHAILDGWSFTSTLTEVLDEYDVLCAAERDNRPLRRPEPPAESFGDQVWRERAALNDPAAIAAFDRILADAAPVRVPTISGGVAHRDRALLPFDEEVREGLAAASARLGVPMKSLLLAAHAVVMSALSHADRVTLGLVVNGRPESAAGTETRGLYLNTLPMNVTVGSRTFAELARECLRTESELLRHRTYPGVAAELAHGRQQLMTTAFNYTRFHAMKRVSGGGEVRRVGHLEEDAPTNYPLYVSFDHGAGGDDHLALIMMASPRHFSDAAVTSLLSCYRTVLTAMARDIDAPTGSVEPVGPPDRPVPVTVTPLPHVIAERIARWPHRTAVRDTTGCTVSYGELHDLVDRAVAGLHAAGVARGDTIGVCLPRDHRLVVAVLAVLAAGAVYVPLGPDQPAARQRAVRDVAGLRHVITAGPLDLDVPLLDIGKLTAHPTPAGSWPELEPGELAYLMFTSGSTGTPKAVMIPHAALAAFDAAIGDRYRPETVVLAATGATFDISIAELLLPLAHGSAIVVFDRGGGFDCADFRTTVKETGVNLVQATPSLWREILDGPADLTGVEAWTGGEALTATLGRDLVERAGTVRNWYGPTETTIWSTVAPLTGDDLSSATVPIGTALPGESAYVLGRGLRMAPDEMPGELFLGGAGVARGYLSDPARTALRFVPDPYGVAGARMYRTGDLAHRRADGTLVFLGRVDDQVKVHGHRVEPGEIEAVLTGIDEVSRAAVVLRDGELVAFVVTSADVDLAALRTRLRDRLPAPLVPRLVRVEALPLSPNGKVDRGRLPEVSATEDLTVAPYAAPSTDAQRVLAEVWQEVLGVAAAGQRDNFLDLGGDSISALRVVARARMRGVAVSVADILGPKTLAEIATTDAAQTVRAAEPSSSTELDGVDVGLAGLDETTARALIARLGRAGEERQR
ncbi:amino acid adenylation domain-containing protein [Micromonospora sp. FIMYZ51]|uniref:amino acid adenylation domain-containing protein n=1 Tax=Micromonospora sp. FIMYZ51 TaxID=3051832 RepID=UPI00311F6C2F